MKGRKESLLFSLDEGGVVRFTCSAFVECISERYGFILSSLSLLSDVTCWSESKYPLFGSTGVQVREDNNVSN